MKKIISSILALIMLVSMLGITSYAEAAVQIYVSPTGNDSNAGTADSPFLTVQRGISELGKYAGQDRELILREGVYYFDKGLTVSGLGSASEKITIKGYDGEIVKLTGAQTIPTSGMTKVTDSAILNRIPEEARNNIYSIDLNTVGITSYGKMYEKNGNGEVSKQTFDFYWNDELLKIARWPNEGYVKTGTDASADANAQTITFKMAEDRISRWGTATDPWVMGFFWKPYDENRMSVSLDIQNKKIVTDGYANVQADARYYVYNLLEELDAEGEYFLDRSTGMFYIYTTDDVASADFQFAINSPAPIVTIKNCKNLNLENLHIGGTTNKGITIADSDAIEIKYCQVFNCMTAGVDFGWNAKVTNSSLYGSEVRNIGEVGVYAYGGDHNNLIPANIVIENNHIHHTGQVRMIGGQGVYIGGTGMKVLHNVIHDIPHEGMHMGGNMNEIAYNEIYNVVTETNDCGIIYGGRDFISEIYVHNNYLHDSGQYGSACMAIYCDDMLSGVRMENNIINRVPKGISMGGGRYHTAKNNLILESHELAYAGIGADQRGTVDTSNAVYDENNPNSPILKNVYSTPLGEGIWAEKYPHLTNLLEDEPGVPKHNTIQYNVLANEGIVNVTALNIKYGTVSDNYNIDPLVYEFTEDRKLNIISKDAFDACPGFSLEALELDKIGVYGDGNYTIPKAEYYKSEGKKQTETVSGPSESEIAEAVEVIDMGASIVNDTKEWDDTNTTISVSGDEALVTFGATGYKTNTYENVHAKCTVKLGEGESGDWAGILLRASDSNNFPWTSKKGYLLVMKQDILELFRYNGGSETLDFVDNFFMQSANEWTNMEIRTYTVEDDTVLIKVFINGNEAFSMKDKNTVMSVKEPGYVNLIVGASEVSVKPFDPQYNTGNYESADGTVNAGNDKKEEVIEPVDPAKPVTVYFNDQQMSLSEEPYIKNDRTMVPFRNIFEKLGAMVEYIEETRKVIATKDNQRILIDLPNELSYVNGVVYNVDAPAELKGDSTMVPVRFVSEALGANVEWDPAQWAVKIYAEGYVPSEDTQITDNNQKPADEEPVAPSYSTTRVFDESKLVKHNVAKLAEGEMPEKGPLDSKNIKDLVNMNKVKEPYYIRGGLPNFRYKLEETNEKLNVVFIGGSITQQDGYRDYICDWLEENFGKRFKFTNAGIGGTNSGLGNTRYNYDVLAKDPDLVFIEFAVNDTNANTTAQSIEQMVRQQWMDNPTTDIMLVYTFAHPNVEIASEGKWTNSAQAQDYVAEHYQIPSVFMGYEAALMIKEGTMLWHGDGLETADGIPIFTRDKTHPNATGSEYYWKGAKPILEELLLGENAGSPLSEEPIEWLAAQNACVIKYGDAKDYVSEAFKEIDASEFTKWNKNTPTVFSAENIGDEFSFDFIGTEAAAYVITGGDCAAVDIIVDGKTVIEGQSIFRMYWGGVTGYCTDTVSTGALPYGKHTVTFRISEKKTDKLQEIKNTTNDPATLQLIEKNPDFFGKTRLIVGAVYAKGEFVTE